MSEYCRACEEGDETPHTCGTLERLRDQIAELTAENKRLMDGMEFLSEKWPKTGFDEDEVQALLWCANELDKLRLNK